MRKIERYETGEVSMGKIINVLISLFLFKFVLSHNSMQNHLRVLK